METLEEDVRVANGIFYEAFRKRDAGLMDRIWAEESEPICIHPGSIALHGRKAVMASWRGILANPSSPPIECSDVQCTVFGGSAIVICREGVVGQPAALIATNVFVREQSGWRLVHHHASPIARMAGEPDRTLN